MRLKEAEEFMTEDPFDRETVLTVCREYYQAKGYSEEHCHKYIDRLDDRELKRVYNTIQREANNEPSELSGKSSK